DRDVRVIEQAGNARPLDVDRLIAQVAQDTASAINWVRIPRDPQLMYLFYNDNEELLYVDPYKGDVRKSQAHAVHSFLHKLEEWHRWLGMEGEYLPTGRLITGVCNLAFLLLCITGLYLWFP